MKRDSRAGIAKLVLRCFGTAARMWMAVLEALVSQHPPVNEPLTGGQPAVFPPAERSASAPQAPFLGAALARYLSTVPAHNKTPDANANAPAENRVSGTRPAMDIGSL